MVKSHLILKNTVALAASRLVEKTCTVCLALMVARYLGVAALGVYSAAIVLFGVVSLVGEMGATTYITREIAKDRTLTGEYLYHLAALSVAVSLLVIGGAWIIIPHLNYSLELALGAHIVTAATIPGAFRTILEGVFVVHQRVEVVTYVSLVSCVANLAASLYLLQTGHDVTSLVVVFSILQTLITTFYFLFVHRRIAPLQWKLKMATFVRLATEIKAFTGSSLLGAVAARPEVLILSVCTSDAQIGLYSAALRIVDLWSVIPETYMRNVFPFLSYSHHVANKRDVRRILENSVKYLTAVSLPLAAGIFVAARPIVETIYGPGFGGTVDAVRIMAWYVPLAFLHEILWRVLAARNEQHLLLRAQVMSLSVRLALGYILISNLASLGAAVTVSVMMAAHCSLLGFYIRRDGSRLGLLRLCWRLSIAAAMTGAVAALLLLRSQLWLVVPVSAVAYGAMVLTLRAVSVEDLAALRKMW